MFEVHQSIRENWLSKKPNERAFYWTSFLVALLLVGSHLSITGWFGLSDWMAANQNLILNHHQYWRLWTSLFAHADIGHALSNLVLFIPFSYFLIGYFGIVFFPLLGFFIGGLINLLTLLTMPAETYLIGASGVVHWMGAAWITLYVLLQSKEKLKIRLLKSFGISLILFIPDSFKPQISYMAHFLGFVLGILNALLFYMIRRTEFKAAEKIHYSFELIEEEPYSVG